MTQAQPTGYEYVKRTDSPYQEISIDSTSSLFHITQIMTAACMYTFPPYNSAGLADLATYLTNGIRSTHLDRNGSVFGFYHNIAEPMSEKQEAFQKAWPEIYEYGKEVINSEHDFKNDQEVLDFLEKTEERFGKYVEVSSTGKLDPMKTFIESNTKAKKIVIILD